MINDKIIRICEQKFIYLNYSQKTADTYIYYIKQFLKSVENVQIAHVNAETFQSYLDTYPFTSVSQQNQIINAIRFLYKFGLNKKYNKVKFQRPRSEKHLPQIIDSKELLSFISKIENTKHKAIISLAYSIGLRVSEVINLRIKDIDSKRMIIHINNAKGKKDRIVPLSQNVLDLLRKYWVEYHPREFLFNGQNSLQYSSASCNKIVKKYIGKNFHFHLLRHSCFTHLLEGGADCHIIKRIAGHKNIKTTEGYFHISKQMFDKIRLPI